METVFQDFRYALRQLRTHPGFAVAVVLTLALGIGANTAVFSVVNGVLLRPLPYSHPDRLVAVFETNPRERIDQYQVSLPTFADFRAESRSFQSLAGYARGIATVSGTDQPLRAPVLYVVGDLFGALEARAGLGRPLSATDAVAGSEPVTVVSHHFWTTQLGARTDAIGASLTIDGANYRLVGVMPPGFGFPDPDIELWVAWPPAPFMMNRAVHLFTVVGRLQPHATVDQARAEVVSIGARIQAANPGADPGHGAGVIPLRDQLVGDTRPALLALLAAVGMVLLIACGNVAGLVVARSWPRRREMAIRAALGAGRGRLARQVLTESLVLALLGGGAGMLLAAWAVQGLRAGLPFALARASEVEVDIPVLVATLAISALCGIGVGLWPALRVPVSRIEGVLRASSGTARSTRGGLVVAEVALSLVLLVGAGLFVRSYWSLRHTDLGFRADHLLFFTTSLPQDAYPTPERVVAYYRALPGVLRALPGVEDASASSALPVSGGDGTGEVTIEGRTMAPGTVPAASYRRVLPGYFHAMGVPLIRGRDFAATDIGADPKVVIISAAMANRLWPAQDPLGRRIKVGVAATEPWLTVVGVVGDVKNIGLAADAGFATYEPHPQRPWTTMRVVVRTAGDPLALGAAVRSKLRALDSRVLVFDMGTMDARVEASIAARRFGTLAIAGFAVAALLLAIIGLYGLLAQLVAFRQREFGVRLALGASSADILVSVAGNGLRLVAIGMGVGLGAAVAVTRTIQHLLFGVESRDLASYAGVSTLFLAVALFACWWPARRATRIDPLTSLRSE
ncbi:MAG TPA: ABC transporter permease [Gemmatimonadales bacterium]|nr:ABC transporter permease [Gemmatimonadales bacterium]